MLIRSRKHFVAGIVMVGSFLQCAFISCSPCCTIIMATG